MKNKNDQRKVMATIYNSAKAVFFSGRDTLEGRMDLHDVVMVEDVRITQKHLPKVIASGIANSIGINQDVVAEYLKVEKKEVNQLLEAFKTVSFNLPSTTPAVRRFAILHNLVARGVKEKAEVYIKELRV